MHVIKKGLLLSLIGLTLAGGGCTGGSSVEDVTANDIETSAYLLPIADESIIPEPQSEGWRIENFVGSDDPRFDYPDNAFFIELKTSGVKSALEKDYDGLTTTTLGLGNNQVLFGDDGAMGGDTWPHDVYFHESSGTTIVVFAQKEEGKQAAKQLLEAIYWY